MKRAALSLRMTYRLSRLREPQAAAGCASTSSGGAGFRKIRYQLHESLVALAIANVVVLIKKRSTRRSGTIRHASRPTIPIASSA
jgi:hypothetical protein